MDLGENPFLLIISESVEMFLKTEVDDTAGVPPEPECEGAMLGNECWVQGCIYHVGLKGFAEMVDLTPQLGWMGKTLLMLV